MEFPYLYSPGFMVTLICALLTLLLSVLVGI
jgi:hypothetical protein